MKPRHPKSSRSIMPQKYRILSSHADAKAPQGRVVSNYPPRKGSKPAKSKRSKGY